MLFRSNANPTTSNANQVVSNANQVVSNANPTTSNANLASNANQVVNNANPTASNANASGYMTPIQRVENATMKLESKLKPNENLQTGGGCGCGYMPHKLNRKTKKHTTTKSKKKHSRNTKRMRRH